MTILKLFIILSAAIATLNFPRLAVADEKSLVDVAYQFDPIKVKAAEDSFHFFRSFVDLFYLSYKANGTKLSTIEKLSATDGWCVGDAHAENFGVLLQNNGRALFTMNDMDDSGPCPVALDLFRFMVGARLYDSKTNLEKIVAAYVDGIHSKDFEIPLSVQDILKKAEKKGMLPSDKKVQNNKIIRDEESKELSAFEKEQIVEALKVFDGVLAGDAKILDLLSTSKVGGGSGGLLRFEVLIDNGGTPLHLELKELVRPAIYPVATSNSGPAERIAGSIRVAQGVGSSKFYQVIKLNGKDMLVRPRFAGNIGISLDKQSKDENADIIRFEAYTLGLIHSQSLKNVDEYKHIVNSIANREWESDVGPMVEYFEKKYKELK